MNEVPLKNKVAVVTGAGRGIGAAIAKRVAGLGATVVLCGRELTRLEATARAIHDAGDIAHPLACDVTRLDSVEQSATEVKSRFGKCDFLINNAGVADFGKPLHQTEPQDWDSMLNTNLRGVYYMLRSYVPLMPAGGQIINISSLAGKNALPNGAAYAASKWGLNGLSISLAEELRPHNIRVAIVCPGSVDTELSPHEGKDPAKMLQPDDIAHAVATLLTQSPNSFISELLVRPAQKP